MEAESPNHVSAAEPAIVMQPNSVKGLPALVEEISRRVQALADGGDVSRRDLVAKCHQLLYCLESPREVMLRDCWAQPGAIAAVNLGIASGLWTLMAQNGDKGQRVSDLASRLAVDPKLLMRTMRHLGAMGYLVETGEDEYMPTNYSKSLSNPSIASGYLAACACTSTAAMKFHEFARERAWRNPTDALDTSLMYAYKTDKNLFAWLECQGYATEFNQLMVGYHLGRKSWGSPGFFPVQERLINGAVTGKPFLVDIGGNVGHDLLQFKRHYPDAPGTLVLQDLEAVIGKITDLDPSIIRMEHDFHNEQPVKGARAYYMRSILHDWPDEVCVVILSRIKEAMEPGYSRLLINEKIMPSTMPDWEITGLDMMMMTLLSSEERTEASWRSLIEGKAGLKISKIWSDRGKSVESVIECELEVL
ncbi:hypothetical protein HIM_11148 [Hirsutella minnesotensis 3608]|uniref:O-methyltransferase C-terminal domain-containing protein n=1 Tax=Hirsutella minnesotensis 3608 TaxID=1043627 RepID=A0A0F7ZJA7_9HYPO|nr:hypothetical protein HIM_11148 [Hirsutella minnesotensis 3608]